MCISRFCFLHDVVLHSREAALLPAGDNEEILGHGLLLHRQTTRLRVMRLIPNA